MRKCKLCNSKMVIHLSKTEPFMDKYFWGCTSFPSCHNIENTILSKMDFQFSYLGNDTANTNSLHELRPTDIVTDAERHFAICKQFNCNHEFQRTDLETLDMLLGFEERDDFHFWIATQQIIVASDVHNHFPVGSPYYHTFRNLTECINQYFDNSIEVIASSKQSLIKKSISVWTDFFRIQNEARYMRLKESEEKIQAEHKEALKRKANKASADIFNAIRRKDLKAIEALRRKGADLNFQNENGMTCLEFARTFGDERLIEALTNNLAE